MEVAGNGWGTYLGRDKTHLNLVSMWSVSGSHISHFRHVMRSVVFYQAGDGMLIASGL